MFCRIGGSYVNRLDGAVEIEGSLGVVPLVTVDEDDVLADGTARAWRQR